MDIKIKYEDARFKFRVGGIIIHNNRVMMVDNHYNNFWCLPGGHVHIGEDTLSAIRREMLEETKITFETAKLTNIIENYYVSKYGKAVHELSFYYLLEGVNIPPEKAKNHHIIENDEGCLINLNFKWIPLNRLYNFDIRPKELKVILKNKDFSFKHRIIHEEK